MIKRFASEQPADIFKPTPGRSAGTHASQTNTPKQLVKTFGADCALWRWIFGLARGGRALRRHRSWPEGLGRGIDMFDGTVVRCLFFAASTLLLLFVFTGDGTDVALDKDITATTYAAHALITSLLPLHTAC